MLSFVIAVGSMTVLIMLYAVTGYFLSQADIFFTSPRTGTAMFVMRGNTVHRMILVWEGYTSGKKRILVPEDKYEVVKMYAGRSPGFLYYLNPLNWLEVLGIHWVGIPPFFKIHRYDFVWTEETIDPQTHKLVSVTRRATSDPGTEGQTKFIYVKDTNYVIVAANAKTKNNVPLRFEMLVTVRIVNPYKALFKGTDWLQRTSGAVADRINKYAGVLTYDQITGGEPAELDVVRDGVAKKEKLSLEQCILMLADDIPDDLKDLDLQSEYGVQIRAAKLKEFDFADEEGRQAYKEATTNKYVKEQEGLGILAQAKGQAEATKTLADAELYRINKVYGPIAGDDNEKRMKIRQLEALEKSGSQGGNTIVLPDTVVGIASHINKLANGG